MTRADDGFTLVEMMVGLAVSVVITAALAVTLISGFRTTEFGSNQSTSLDAARLTLNQVARDLQGSKQFENCTQVGEPAGTCIMMVVQPPTGADQIVRYRVLGAHLHREVDDGTGTFPKSEIVSDRIANVTKTPQQALFVCNSVGSLLQVTINMIVQPNPVNAPTYRLQTVVRPRNSYLPPTC